MERWEQQDFDAIVVGSGPGGATVAKELSQRGKKTLILERGGSAPVKGTRLQCTALWCHRHTPVHGTGQCVRVGALLIRKKDR
jgi:choline dehydrogenase-like flavoprotein